MDAHFHRVPAEIEALVSINKLPRTWPTIMSDGTAERVEHGKYVGVRGEPRRDGVCLLRKRSVLISVYFIESCDSLRPETQ